MKSLINESNSNEADAKEISLERVKELAMLGARDVFNMSLAEMAAILKAGGKTLSQNEFNVLVIAGRSAEISAAKRAASAAKTAS